MTRTFASVSIVAVCFAISALPVDAAQVNPPNVSPPQRRLHPETWKSPRLRQPTYRSPLFLPSPSQDAYRSFSYEPAVPANAANLIFDLPSNAEISLQGEKMGETGPTRHFYSPPLEPNKNYIYTVRIEVAQGDRTLSKTVKIPIRAGEWVRVTAVVPQENPDDLAVGFEPITQPYRSFSFEPRGAGTSGTADEVEPSGPRSPVQRRLHPERSFR